MICKQTGRDPETENPFYGLRMTCAVRLDVLFINVVSSISVCVRLETMRDEYIDDIILYVLATKKIVTKISVDVCNSERLCHVGLSSII